MVVYIVGWPNNSWSVLASRRSLTIEEMTCIGGPIDASADPGEATILKAVFEGGEFYCDLPEHQTADSPPGWPLLHAGSVKVIQLRAPYGAVVAELQALDTEDLDTTGGE